MLLDHSADMPPISSVPQSCAQGARWEATPELGRGSSAAAQPRADDVVLVVEDNLDARELFCAVLDMEGYATLTAADGLEALQLLARIAPPRLILLDLRMPRMNGLELRDRLKADPALASIPVVFVSASPEMAPVGVPYLQKPVPPDALLRVVRQFCRRAAAQPVL